MRPKRESGVAATATAAGGTGVAALYLDLNSSVTPAQVRDAIVDNATSSKISDPGAGSPNELLFSKVSRYS
jgi:hypothetical protein